jgi:restriction system protein
VIGLIAGWKFATFGGTAATWGFVILVATFTVVGILMVMIAASVVLKSPRWRLLDLQRDLADVIRMTGLQFEQFVAELLEARGFDIERRGGWRPDGGIDMIASMNGRSYVVQCKQWRQYIGRPLLQQLYGVVVSTGANGGLFVTTGLFSDEGHEFVDGLRSPKLRLVDGSELWAAVLELRARAALEA